MALPSCHAVVGTPRVVTSITNLSSHNRLLCNSKKPHLQLVILSLFAVYKELGSGIVQQSFRAPSIILRVCIQTDVNSEHHI